MQMVAHYGRITAVPSFATDHAGFDAQTFLVLLAGPSVELASGSFRHVPVVR